MKQCIPAGVTMYTLNAECVKVNAWMNDCDETVHTCRCHDVDVECGVCQSERVDERLQ